MRKAWEWRKLTIFICKITFHCLQNQHPTLSLNMLTCSSLEKVPMFTFISLGLERKRGLRGGVCLQQLWWGMLSVSLWPLQNGILENVFTNLMILHALSFLIHLLLETRKQGCSLMQWQVSNTMHLSELLDWHILYFTLVLSLILYSYTWRINYIGLQLC